MSFFFQLVVSGLTTGAIYAALALALVLIFRATNVVNFGQGEMATFSAYGAWQLMQWGVPLWLAVLASLVAAFAIGIVTFRLIIRPMMDAPVEATVVVTLGILVLFQAACMWIWGAEQLSFPNLFPDGGFSIGDVRVLVSAVGTLAILLAIALAMGSIFRFTKLGLSMRAAAFDRTRSVLVGVDVERMLMLGWGFAAVIGALAAILIAPR